MSATSEHTTLNLNGDAMLGYCIIEPPTPCRVEAVLTDTLATEIAFNQSAKQVLCDRIVLRVTFSCYFLRFLRLSHFLSFFCIVYHLHNYRAPACAYYAVLHCEPTNTPNDWYYQSLGMCNVG